MTEAPLPTWRQLRHSLTGALKPDDLLTAPWRRPGDVAGLLSRSSWSLALIAEWRRRISPGRPISFWLPAFFCNSALVALRRGDVEFTFYDVDDALEPEMASLRALAAGNTPDIVMAVHYFGRPSPTAGLHDFCKRHHAWLIEDAAHVLAPCDGVGVHGDFVVYSPHKHLPTPDGAVLVARENGAAALGSEGVTALGAPSTWPAQLQRLEADLGPMVRGSRTRSAIWLTKRVLQKLGVGRTHTRAPFAEPPAGAEHADLPPPTCSTAGRRLLGAIGDFGARKRDRHQLLWDALAADDKPHVTAAGRPQHRAWTPYLAAYVSTAAEETYRQWGNLGRPVTTWPDLPPEVKIDTSKYAHAWRLRHSRIYLPVHSSLSDRAIMRRAKVEAPSGGDADVDLRWVSPSRDEWSGWLSAAGRSNLLQDWAYGVAKAEESGWSVRRVVFSRRGSAPIAIAQLLERRIAGVAALRRLNRGPLFLGEVSKAERIAVWRGVARMGSLFGVRALSIAPEAVLSPESLRELLAMGFRPSDRAAAWQSVWLALDAPTDDLRRGLRKEWRNALSAAERAGLRVDVSSDADAFDWMIDRYGQLMTEKHFTGPAVSLLKALRASAADGHVMVFRAWLEAAPIAGVLIVRHGDAATYLVGWNGPAGRQHKASHLLLWSAVVHLQAAGVRAFDLGGISDDQTPGISAFKLGMGGDRYELVGEWMKW